MGFWDINVTTWNINANKYNCKILCVKYVFVDPLLTVTSDKLNQGSDRHYKYVCSVSKTSPHSTGVTFWFIKYVCQMFLTTAGNEKCLWLWQWLFIMLSYDSVMVSCWSLVHAEQLWFSCISLKMIVFHAVIWRIVRSALNMQATNIVFLH